MWRSASVPICCANACRCGLRGLVEYHINTFTWLVVTTLSSSSGINKQVDSGVVARVR